MINYLAILGILDDEKLNDINTTFDVFNEKSCIITFSYKSHYISSFNDITTKLESFLNDLKKNFKKFKVCNDRYFRDNVIGLNFERYLKVQISSGDNE